MAYQGSICRSVIDVSFCKRTVSSLLASNTPVAKSKCHESVSTCRMVFSVDSSSHGNKVVLVHIYLISVFSLLDKRKSVIR